jgi:hypothetical protein
MGNEAEFRRTDAKPQTKAYRLKAGARHTADGQELIGGAEVQLTDTQYAAFRDKFEPTGAPTQPVQGAKPQDTSGIAQDTGAKTKPGEPNALKVPDEPGPATNPADRDLKRGR